MTNKKGGNVFFFSFKMCCNAEKSNQTSVIVIVRIILHYSLKIWEKGGDNKS